MLQVEVLVPLNPGNNLDVKYLPEEDVIVLVSELGSISVYNLTSSEVCLKFISLKYFESLISVRLDGNCR